MKSMNNNNNNNMCAVLGLVFTVMIIMTFDICVEASTQFKVGESIGWREPDKNNTSVYSQWAAKNRFLVEDSLYFVYANDSVLVVDKEGYYHCNLANPISSFNNGKTVIKLDKVGPAYFVSGAPEHCKNGQRLVVDVISPHPPSPLTPPSIPSPPFFPDSPAPSTTSSSDIPLIAQAPIPILMALVITTIVVMLV